MSVRVLVVDDSRFYRRRVSEILSLDGSLEVVGSAKDGAEAVELTRILRPDVVTMDVEMPVMDGITATRRIMESTPTPILMFSGQTTTGARATLDALEAGAADYIPKRFESIAEEQDLAIATLCRRIRQLKQVKAYLERETASAAAPISNKDNRTLSHNTFDIQDYRLLAIGTSTGGPVALQSILTKLPEDFPLPVLLVQHMPGSFTPAFAQRLNALCKIKVKEAVNNENLEKGVAYVAPGGYQTIVTGSIGAMQVRIESAQLGEIYKPCIDSTYKSLAKIRSNKILAVILTGMGSDGTEGAKSLKLSGATVWAQDVASSLVPSMPSSVAATGIADRILSLDAVGSILAGSG